MFLYHLPSQGILCNFQSSPRSQFDEDEDMIVTSFTCCKPMRILVIALAILNYSCLMIIGSEIKRENRELAVRSVSQNSSTKQNVLSYTKPTDDKLAPRAQVNHEDENQDVTSRTRRDDLDLLPLANNISHSTNVQMISSPGMLQVASESINVSPVDKLAEKILIQTTDKANTDILDQSTSESTNRGVFIEASPSMNKYTNTEYSKGPQRYRVREGNRYKAQSTLEEKLEPQEVDDDQIESRDEVKPPPKLNDFNSQADIIRVGVPVEIKQPITIPESMPPASDIERTSAGTVNDELALDDDMQDEDSNNRLKQSYSLPVPGSSPETYDNIPDSMDSLMNGHDQEDLADISDENNPSASSPLEGTKIEPKINQQTPPPAAPTVRKSTVLKKPLDPYEDDIDYDDSFELDEPRSRSPKLQAKQTTDTDLNVAAGYHHSKKKHHGHGHDHGKYYMYAKVPKKKSWEFGYKRGNKKHWIERHEKGHKNKFKTKVKWYDKKSKGKGIHIWDYNHHDKKKKHHY